MRARDILESSWLRRESEDLSSLTFHRTKALNFRVFLVCDSKWVQMSYFAGMLFSLRQHKL